jgi:uncharacterized membrane protein YgcG
MQRNIQPSQSSLAARLGPVIGAFASVVFWLVLAASLPASTVARYVPEAAPWVPIACYALAVYSLVAGLRRLRGAVLAGRGRQSQAKSQASSARSAGARPASRPMGRSSGGGGRSANDNPGGSGSVQARHRPTVQRMR